jgi:N-acetylglucosaminyl-diphospho-decaprenol L-rhamnosyltransferase
MSGRAMRGTGPSLDSTTVVVVNWNNPELTRRCVEALLGDGVPPARIVLVDNGSGDASLQILRSTFPACRFVVLERNIGYARAARRGAAVLEGTAYLFVNNDAFVHEPGSVVRLLAALARDTVGIAVPRLLNVDLTLQPSVQPLPTPAAAFSLATGLSRVLPQRVRPSLSTHWHHGESGTIVAARGAVLAVRGAVWHELEGWSERDWMFGEDLELFWRARKRGWKAWFERDAVFVHLGNATGYEDARRTALAATATRNLIERELGSGRAAFTTTILAAGHLLRAPVFALLGRRSAARSALAAAAAYAPLRATRSSGPSGDPTTLR